MGRGFGGMEPEALRKYIGEWVIICDKKVVAHDKSLLKIKDVIPQCKRTPTIALIPGHEIWLF